MTKRVAFEGWEEIATENTNGSNALHGVNANIAAAGMDQITKLSRECIERLVQRVADISLEEAVSSY